MNVKVLSMRTGLRATIWFVDPLGIIGTAMLGLLGTAVVAKTGLLDAALEGHWWIGGLLVLLPSCWRTRLRVTRANPGEVVLVVSWLIFPLRRRRCPVAAVRSEHADDWTSKIDDPHDLLVLGDYEMDCRNADRVRAWIVAAAMGFSTPVARAKEDGR